VLVVGPNLSIDQTVAVPQLAVGAIHRVPEILRLAGDKGANVARAARLLDADPLLIGFVGGQTGELFAAYLRADGIASHLVRTAGETRVCFSIADDATGEQTEFYEAGAPVRSDEIALLVAAVEAHLPAHAWVVITGSLPRGAPEDLYARIIELAHRHRARVLLDAREGALTAGVAARPDVVKINSDELAELALQAPETPAAVAEAASHVPVVPGGAVIVTLGAAGAVVVRGEGRWQVTPPAIKARSPVGSGDCAAAGVIVGLERGDDFVEATRLGVAAGTANAMHLGAARFTVEDVGRVLAGCVARAL
jgi:1-phosphofructokinase family hexose kinase